MSNRRRSERYAVTLPVWLKDGRGGERTHTVDVSAHGIAVLATHGRPLRQYVELELRLKDPEASIAVTAVVARHAELLHPETGAGVQGLGLDFFLFDAQAKAAWQAFIHKLHAEGPVPQPAPVSAPPPEPPPAEDEDDTPTFIIKPRDLGRLWAFFRGEMAKGMVRIETPILKPVGSPAELLVVHPTSLAEWALPGRVARATEAGRGGRPVLEIGLTPMSADSKAAFRNFVATGRGQVEEEVLISSEVSVDDPLAAPAVASDPAEDEPERIESVVIDLDNLDGDEGFGDRDALLEEGLIEAPRRYVTHPVTPQTPGAPVERDGPEDDPTQHAPAPLPPPARAASGPARRREAEERPTSVFASFFAEAGMGEPSVEAGPTPATPAWAQQEPTGESEVDLAAASRAKSQARRTPPPLPPSDLDEGDLDYPDGDRTTGPLGTSLAHGPAGRRSLEEPIPLVKRRAPPPVPAAPSPAAPPTVPAPSTVAAPPVVAAPPPAPRRAVPPLPPSARMRANTPAPAAAPASIPTAARDRRRANPDPSVQVRPISVPPEDPAQALRPEPAVVDQRAAVNPPVPPGQMFDFGDPSQPGFQAGQLASQRDPSGLVITPRSDPNAKVKPPGPAVRAAAIERVGPRRGPGRRGPAEEPERAQEHRMLSTEGTNPGLDRDIALARARMVRSPHSVTACYRLSALLLQRGENGALDEAVSALERVMEMEPNHPGAHHKLAELHARRGDYERAAEHLGRARRLGYQVDPDLERLITSASRGSGG